MVLLGNTGNKALVVGKEWSKAKVFKHSCAEEMMTGGKVKVASQNTVGGEVDELTKFEGEWLEVRGRVVVGI